MIFLETKFNGCQMKEEPYKYPLVYTGQAYSAKVSYIMRGPVYGLADCWVIMSLE